MYDTYFESHDIDLLVVGCSQDKLFELAKSHNVKQVGKDFGVYLFNTSDFGTVEVALARKERSTGNGSRDLTLTLASTSRLKKDLARRDFTMNAMAIDMTPGNVGKIHDPFNGRQHIEKHVLHPVAGFSEDPTRVWRCCTILTAFLA
jgi:tRNA nucleotidyltransferase/poly(A) polymerase